MKHDGNKKIECSICGKKVKLKDSGNVAGVRTCDSCYKKELRKLEE
jgi:hypothetical protein